MSKVKGEIFELNKAKLIHCLRRKETAKKKKSCILKYKMNAYGCQRGYYLKFNNGEMAEETDEPFILARIKTNLIIFRKFANRKVRNTYKDELFQGSLYKKIYEIEWGYV